MRDDRLLLLLIAATAASSALAATPPYIQLAGQSDGFANTCAAASAPAHVLVNLDVPAGDRFGYTVAYIDNAFTYVYGPNSVSLDQVKVPMYTSPLQSGPIANSAAPFGIGTPATWYQGAPFPAGQVSLPDHTRLNVTLYTYAANDGTDPYSEGNTTSSASVTWDCSTGEIIEAANTGNSVSAGPAPLAKQQAVEFYNATLDHYFLSASPAEIGALDAGQIPGWRRTGQAFAVFAAAADGATPVCRYYIPPELGDSHFYSASPGECAAVHTNFPALTPESPAVFYVLPADPASGICPVTTQPVYRLWNGRADSNHRYTIDAGLRDRMIAQGYTGEGYGPDGVSMCAPL